MKKLIAAVLSLIFVLSLCSCSVAKKESGEAGEPAPSSSPAAENTPALPEESSEPDAEPESAPAEEAEPHIIARIKISESQSFKDADGSELVNFTCSSAELAIPGREDAAALINADIPKDCAGIFWADDKPMTYDEVIEMARSDRANRLESVQDSEWEWSFVPYCAERKASVVRADGAAVSLLYSNYIYTGGVHGYSWSESAVYSTRTGKLLSRADICGGSDEAFLRFCADYITDLSHSDDYADYHEAFYEDYEQDIPDVISSCAWYLSNEGAVFAVNAYELGPYAMGGISFCVPYSALKGLILDEYIPAERDGKPGSVSLVKGAAGSFTASIDKGHGEGAVLKVSGSVYDLTIASVTNFYDDFSFSTDSDAIFVGQCHDGDSFFLRDYYPDVAPAFSVSYTDGAGEKHEYILTQSGEDGSILMIPRYSGAVG
jgi:hypothetical protein